MLTQLSRTARIVLAVLPAAARIPDPTPAMVQSPGLVSIAPHAYAWIATDDRSSNSALVVGDSIALVVDPGLTPAVAAEFLAAVRRVTDKPVRYAVLTHWHPDHAFGVTCLAGRSFQVVAHGKTRRALAERGTRVARALAEGARTTPEREALAGCRASLPERIVDAPVTLDLGGRRVQVFHPGWAHTAGDLVVWEPEEGVLVTGDIMMHEASPDMGEAHPTTWASVLDSLVALHPRAVVAGHFGPSRPADLLRFRDYLHAVVTGTVDLARAFPTFAQYPQYNATFAGNAGDAQRERAARAAPRGETAGFATLAVFDVGRNPHQIAFSATGETAFIAVAGADRVAVVDARTYQVLDTLAVTGTPLGVFPNSDGSLTVTRFQRDAIARYAVAGHAQAGAVATGGIGASLFAPLPEGEVLVSVERANTLLRLDPATLTISHTYPTGSRPFPPGATSDGRLAFVPNYDGGTVTVIDLFNHRVIDTVAVGVHPSGGAVLPGDLDYAVAVRGENKILFINTASHRVVDSLVDGIGTSPFSVVVSPDGRLAFVNNTGSHDISVVALPERRVVARIPVGEIPIVMAVHPSGTTLWVSSEGSHRMSVLAIPEQWRAHPEAATPSPSPGTTEVAVMGMIHGAHRTSARWGLPQVRETVRRFRPDVVCAEIAPDRWERIWSEYTERGVIEDPRVRRFPEYADALLALSVEEGFTIEPCAAWTQEMSDLRNARIRTFDTDPAYANARKAYAERLAAVQTKYDTPLDGIDDPRVIHSEAYDARQREELELYDEYQNDLIGPGGWTNINAAHLRLIDRTIRAHRGQRVLITFGAGHKYRFLDHLRQDQTVTLLDLGPFLP